MAKRRREIQKRKKQPEERRVEVREQDRGKQQRMSEPAGNKVSSTGSETVVKDTWYPHNREKLLLGLLALYVFFLGLGTVGELFEIEWILNLPLFK
jgi:hypothetical protein